MIPLPSVCPQCRSTAVEEGVAMATCCTCSWRGSSKDLLVVASEGLTLEETVDVFTRDLLTMVGFHLSKPLGEFLIRWDIVKPDDKEPMRYILARSVQEIAGTILEFVMACAHDAKKGKQG